MVIDQDHGHGARAWRHGPFHAQHHILLSGSCASPPSSLSVRHSRSEHLCHMCLRPSEAIQITRNEVLLAEAVEVPAVASGCKLSGGLWKSYYDGQEVNDPAKLDIDHMVPLAEAWDSGAAEWTAARREAYANDQEAAISLVAVTARSNRAKADRDPAEWMPPLPEAHCRYVGEWTATKLRWGLAADQAEADALKVYAEACETTVVHYTPAP
ncbi:HNH endonuclease family protein [Streptomyces sp. NPDC056269]|uniref:HNH endonuclease family protein n=1 Tax=Streptomyces sp. NPDC056269 TaxID=3345768 RepID=UPI0035DE9E6B